jgi:hypothetical protein
VRVLILRAAVVVAAALAGAAVTAAPAWAAPGVTVQLSPTSFDMKGGDSRTLTVKLTNSGPLARIDLAVTAPSGLTGDVTVSSSDSSCSGSGSAVSCTVDILGNGQKTVLFTLKAKNPDSLGTGQSRTDTSGTVSATVATGSTQLSYPVTLHGPAQTQTKTATPGGTGTATGGSGSRTPSSTGTDPTTTADPSASASTDVSTDPSASDAGALDAMPYRTGSGTGGLSWLLIGFGVLLVLAGVATLVMLVIRRRARERTRDRVPERRPAPPVDAALRPSSAPVDPWDSYPEYR